MQDGFYSNRTDFIHAAIRNQIDRHADAAKQAVLRKRLDLGLNAGRSGPSKPRVRAAGEQLDIRVLGLTTIAADVTAEAWPWQPSPRSPCRVVAGECSGEGRARGPHDLKRQVRTINLLHRLQCASGCRAIPHGETRILATKVPVMNAILADHIAEATPHPRSGWRKPPALLQRLVQGESRPVATAWFHAAEPGARPSRIIDVDLRRAK